MIRSIRLTLTFWYIGILAFILCVFAFVLYTKVSTNLLKDVDELLVSQAEGITEAFFSFWEAEKNTVGSDSSLEQEIKDGRIKQWITQWSKQTSELEFGHPYQIIDREGHILFTSPSFQKLNLPITAPVLSEVQQECSVYQTFVTEHHRVRLVTYPFLDAKTLLYIVQVANSLTPIDNSLNHLGLWLMGLIPLTLALTSLMGWFLATVALRPIGKMISQVRQIRGESLNKRIQEPATKDELQQLAKTFNDMLARIEQTFFRLRQFSASASHELRTPLAIMKGELEVALKKPRDNEEYQRVLHVQLDTLNEMIRLTEELLTLVRSEAGQGVVEWQPIELGALAHKIGRAWRVLSQAKLVEIVVEAPAPIWVSGEKRLLERLIANLMDNAIKHSQKGGRILIHLEQQNTEALLRVQDHGQGISSEDLPKIFDQFLSRVTEDSEKRTRGFGLGLCRWIAEAHQGRIEVSSKPGQGAVFNLFLPLITPKI